MKTWTNRLAIAGCLLVGWTSMGCVVVAEDNVDDLTDTQVLDDTTSAEDGMSGDATSATFELIGEWDTNYGESYSITNEMWGASSIQAFDNAANWAVTQYSEDDEWNPNAFAKQVWTDIDADGFFYQCTVIFSAETLQEALDAENTADENDVEGEGCSGFPWTQFGPPGSFE